MQVAILGISANESGYAHQAAIRLLSTGHQVFGVNPRLPQVKGVRVESEISMLPAGIHTLTVYVSSPTSSELSDAILSYGFSRVIFNPGAENPQLAERLRQANVEVKDACTLVMLATGQF